MGWDKVGWGAGREMLHFWVFLIPHCYFLIQHRCCPPGSKPSGRQKASKGSGWALENRNGASTAAGGDEGKMLPVSKEAQRNEM